MGEPLMLPQAVDDESKTTHRKRKESPTTQKRKELETLAKARLASWESLAQAHNPYLSVSKDDLINWLVLAHEESLSTRELEKIEKLFFDQVRFARQMLQKLITAEDESGNHEQLFMLYKKHLKPAQNPDVRQDKTVPLTVRKELKKTLKNSRKIAKCRKK